jgi:hypothetical protein
MQNLGMQANSNLYHKALHVSLQFTLDISLPLPRNLSNPTSPPTVVHLSSASRSVRATIAIAIAVAVAIAIAIAIASDRNLPPRAIVTYLAALRGSSLHRTLQV